MSFVRPNIRDEHGGFSEECVSTDTACFVRGNVDKLTGRFAAEWTEQEGVWRGKIRGRGVARTGKI